MVAIPMIESSTVESTPPQKERVKTASADCWSRLLLWMTDSVLPPKVNIAIGILRKKTMEVVRLMAYNCTVPKI